VSLWPAITSEWIKFRSLRSTRFALLVTVVLSVGISALLCFAERQQWPMQDAPTHLSFDPTATMFDPSSDAYQQFGDLSAAAFLVLFATFLFIAYVLLYALTRLPAADPSNSSAGETLRGA
jgi:hypothetical protein